MKVLIADDEPLARARLRRMLDGCARWQCVGEAGDGDTALEACQRLTPDAVLLDISMPGRNGIEVAQLLRAQRRAPAVIFITAHAEHAVTAFDVAATHYLLKPVARDQLLAALERVVAPEPDPPAGTAHTHLRVQLRGRVQWVPASGIRYFEADQKYVTAHGPSREYLIEDSLVSLARRLGPAFTRIHRKTLVNRAFVQALGRDDNGRAYVQLNCGTRLTVSRRCAGVLRDALDTSGVDIPFAALKDEP